MSCYEKLPGRIIQSGYGWSMRVTVNGSATLFPANSTFRASVRRSPDVPDVLHEMTTANGGIKRIDNTTLELYIPGTVTKNWPSRKAYIDIARVDTPQPVHLGFRMIIPVQQPITRIA